MTTPTIRPDRLEALRRDGAAVEVIDVRTPAEFRELHASCARNVPLDRLDPDAVMKARTTAPDQPLYLICHSGSRGEQACRRLQAAGHTNVVNVEGGTLAWEQAGLPVVRGKKTISLERQVRIAAGSLALAGSVLALLIDPWFAGVPAFIGAGLVFAGVTDTCGMGMLLARMPWNQVRESGPACCSGPSAAAPAGKEGQP